MTSGTCSIVTIELHLLARGHIGDVCGRTPFVISRGAAPAPS